MNANDLRIFVYEQLVERGVMPSLTDIGHRFSATATGARDAIRAAGLRKTLLPDPRTGEIWMAGPFSAVPTSYRVRAGRRMWWANCAWDMLGIAALVGGPVEIEAQCTDCGQPMPMHIDLREELDIDAVVHFLVPARRWYDDIGFT